MAAVEVIEVADWERPVFDRAQGIVVIPAGLTPAARRDLLLSLLRPLPVTHSMVA